jgi:hypothetical protein
MANPKIKWNIKAFGEIAKSEEVQAALQDKVDAVLEDVGDELYKGEVSVGKNRAAGRVWTAGTHAERSNAKHNTLLTALAKLEGEAQ